MAGADGTTYDASKGNRDEQLKDGSVIPVMGRRRAELDEMRKLIEGKRQLGVAVPPLPEGSAVTLIRPCIPFLSSSSVEAPVYLPSPKLAM